MRLIDLEPERATEVISVALESAVLPIKEQLEQLDEAIAAEEAKLATFRDLRRQTQRVLYALHPEQNPKGQGQKAMKGQPRASAEIVERKIDFVADYLRDKGENGLADGFTIGYIIDSPDFPSILPGERAVAVGGLGRISMTRDIFPALLDRGIIRADKRVKGGGMSYKLVGQ